MDDILFRVLLGHLVGDYLPQGKTMALKKSEKSFVGFFWCTLHVAIYSLSVCLFLWTASPLIFLLVFSTHWPIDRWSLASYWLKLIKGRDFQSAYLSKDKYREFDISFTAIVYTVVDNTFHLITLWLIVKFFM